MNLRDDIIISRYHPDCCKSSRSSALMIKRLAMVTGQPDFPTQLCRPVFDRKAEPSGNLLRQETAFQDSHRLTPAAGSLKWLTERIMPSSHLHLNDILNDSGKFVNKNIQVYYSCAG